MELTVPKVLLLALAVWGFWTLWGFPYTNGLLTILSDLSNRGASIPGPVRAPMKQHYTGIRPLDKQITTLVGFFYTAVDGHRLDISLSFLNLGGQVLAAWMLITMESLRAGNKNKPLVTSLTLFGLLVALIGFACVAPLYFVLQLSTASTVIAPRDFDLVVTSPLHLALAPIATMIGFGLPSVMMALPAPDVLSYEAKQTWIGIQQGWPLWIALAQLILSVVVSALDPMASVMTEEDRKARTVKYMRYAYAFALMSSAGVHLTWVSAGLVAYAFPSLLHEPFLSQLQPSNLFRPVVPFGPLQAQTLPNGALWFLQWDLYTGTLAVMLWGLTLRAAAAKRTSASSSQTLQSIFQIIALTLLVGPAGSAVVAVWARDELIFAQSSKRQLKKA